MDLAGKTPERSRRHRAIQTKHLKIDPRHSNESITTTPKGFKDRVGIEQRPEVVDERTHLGDLEVDLMVGKAHYTAIVVITDRATLLTHPKKITNCHVETTELAIIESLARIPKVFTKTVTIDNDKALATHRWHGGVLYLTLHVPV